MPDARSLKRLLQLCEGTRAAAAALAREDVELSERATSVVERLSDLGRRLASATASDSTAEALESTIDEVSALHFDLLRVKVLDADAESLSIGENLDRLEDVAARAESELGPAPQETG